MTTTASEGNHWQPDWSVPPGDVLLETLEARSMTQAELARRMGRPLKTINEIVKAKAAVTPDTAIQLERALGVSAHFWNGLETNYRAQIARRKAIDELQGHVEWGNRFPIRDLAKHGLVRSGAPKSEVLEDLLKFFAVGSPARLGAAVGTLARALSIEPIIQAGPSSVVRMAAVGRDQSGGD